MISFASTLRRMKIAAIAATAAIAAITVAPTSSGAATVHTPTVRQVAARIVGYHIPSTRALRVIEYSCNAYEDPEVRFLDLSFDLTPITLAHPAHRAAELYVHLGVHHIGLHLARLTVATGPAGSSSMVLHPLFSARFHCAG